MVRLLYSGLADECDLSSLLLDLNSGSEKHAALLFQITILQAASAHGLLSPHCSADFLSLFQPGSTPEEKNKIDSRNKAVES